MMTGSVYFEIMPLALSQNIQNQSALNPDDLVFYIPFNII